MGLFGFNAKKKVIRAEQFLAEGSYFDAEQVFAEVLARAKPDQHNERKRAESGSRTAREKMIEARMSEARAHLAVGEVEAARRRMEVAIDLAGTDIDTAPIRAALRDVAEPTAEKPVADTRPKSVPVEPTDTGRHVDHLTQDELLASDPMHLFDIYMNSVPTTVADVYRAQPEAFQLGYVASYQGSPRLAEAYFDQCSWDPLPDDAVVLERAQVYYALGQGEDALFWMDRMKTADEVGALQLRVVILRDLGRFEPSIEVAEKLVRSFESPNPAADATLAWAFLAAGRPGEAWGCVQSWAEGGSLDESVLIPAAEALRQLGRLGEAAQTIENLVHYRLHLSLQHEEEPKFPVEAARRLLNLYLSDEFESDPQAVETLLLHLLDFDPQNAETYRSLLLR